MSESGMQEQTPKSHRRSHRKSRNGCAECKRRHIRCDERRPACANCSIAERTCVFPTPPTAAPDRKPPSRNRLSPSSSPGVQSPHSAYLPHAHTQNGHQSPSTTAWSSSRAATPSDTHHAPTSEPSPLPSFGESFPQSHDISLSDPPLFTAEHLGLLYHVTLARDSYFMSAGQDKHVLDIATRLAGSHPYLIDQVLALAALHKATTASPSESSHLSHVATELQTRAITRFTQQASTLPPEDTASSIPRFLFAAVLSLHDLADTLSSIRNLHHSQFHVFVNRFVDCFRIHHGVRAVIRPTWHHLLTSELQPFLSVTNAARMNLESNPASGDECRPLHQLLDASDLGPATVTACREAVDQLQWAFDLYRNLPQPSGGPHAASAFSVTVPTEYIHVLRRLQPEAVIVLAYYGVLLHYCRHYWIFGDSGAFVVRAVAQHLGSYWGHAMAWPLSVVQDDDQALRQG